MNSLKLTNLVNSEIAHSHINLQQQKAILGGKKLLGACTRYDGDKAACAGFGMGLFKDTWDLPSSFPYQDGFKAYDDGSFEPLN